MFGVATCDYVVKAKWIRLLTSNIGLITILREFSHKSHVYRICISTTNSYTCSLHYVYPASLLYGSDSTVSDRSAIGATDRPPTGERTVNE